MADIVSRLRLQKVVPNVLLSGCDAAQCTKSSARGIASAIKKTFNIVVTTSAKSHSHISIICSAH